MDTSIVNALDFYKNNRYEFEESTHTYYLDKVNKVETSVTAFISKYWKEFDQALISYNYSLKHGLNQQDVIDAWERTGLIAAISGTIIHRYLEAKNNGKIIQDDYSEAISNNVYEEVLERVRVLKPKAEKFITDIQDKLIPLKLEYTVGYKDKLAGNIDMLAYNKKQAEIQIWDYKNCKEIATKNIWDKCCYPFDLYDDCNFIHYSIQLSCYKALAENLLGISIGNMYIVHFSYEDKSNNYSLYKAVDFSSICKREIGIGND